MRGKVLGKSNHKVCRLPLCDLSWVLSMCEPVSLQPCVLDRLIRRGAKSSSQSQLLEILEFMTSFSPETSILPEHQQLGGFMQLVADANERLGRRAAALTFPVDWHVSGVYALIGLDQAFKSSSRRLGGAFCS